MIEYDEKAQRMVLKLVYYGPALSGKTTNLLRLNDLLAGDGRSDLIALDTSEDRTIFFDLLPFYMVAPSGLKIKLKVFTVPGQVRHDVTRKAVLQRADGVAFIADSQLAESANNAASFDNLEMNLMIVGLDIERLPLVVQFNKRDLHNTVTDEEIRKTWEPTGIPVYMASALQGWGVLETFRELTGSMYDKIDRHHRLRDEHGLERGEFIRKLTSFRQ